MKKIKTLFIIGLLIICSNLLTVNATEIANDDFVYEENIDGTISIIDYIGENVGNRDYTLIIPSEVNNKKVYSIKNLNCFCEHIIVEDGIIKLESEAFIKCHFLGAGSITLPNSIYIIDDNAFLYCNTTIIADNNSYARTYANNHNISFCCIKHTDIKYVPKIEPTSELYGKESGYICSVCGTIISGCETINKLNLIMKTKPIKPTIKNDTLSKGSIIVNSKYSYKIINNNSVEFLGKTNKKNIIIPSKIIYNGKKYKVISITKNAFKNNKNVQKVIIGNNITKIRANSFKGCKNLKTIIIKSKKIKTIEKNAFKKIYKKVKIKVPKRKFKSYKKLFTKKGLKNISTK